MASNGKRGNNRRQRQKKKACVKILMILRGSNVGTLDSDPR